MRRRDFLSRSAQGMAALGLAQMAPFAHGGDSWKQAFAQQLQNSGWLMGYADAAQNSYAAQARVHGKWPAGLTGTLYRNGPARHEIGDYRYRHWFDGDGMIHAYQMGPQGVAHQARFIETYKFTAEQQAGRALYPGFGSLPPNPAPVTSPDTVNPANISVLHHHGKLMALWEAGSPWEIDPQNLHTKGVYSFTDHTRGVPFSAHPRVEADGNLWNFGYLSQAKIMVMWHIDKHGQLVKIGKLKVDPITMVHDFIVTDKHLVLLIPPLHYDKPEATNFLDGHTWHGQDPTRVLVVNKNDFDDHYFVELPAQWVFHFGNGWEDDHGIIRFDAARADDPLVMISSFRDIMRGKITPAPTSQHHHYRLDTRKRTITETPMFAMNVDTEFPCIDPRVSCRHNDRLVMMSRKTGDTAPHTNLNSVSNFSFASGKRDDYRYPDTQIPEEHLFVPRAGSTPEADGWIVGTALDWQHKKHLLNVFDANRLAQGPVATAELPYAMPLGLHGKFVAA